MSIVIHAQQGEGGLRFRLWETERDAYWGPATNEEEARLDLICDALFTAVADVENRLQRAAQNGSSSFSRRDRSLTDPWEKEMRHNDFPPSSEGEETDTERERRLKVRAILEKIIATHLAD